MCKILILQSHNPSQRDTIISRAWEYFHRSGETDGCGALWISERGHLSWYKSSVPSLSSIDSLPAWADVFGERGGDAARPSDGGWLLMHGRKATCGVSLENTHPMLSDEDAGLVHNGVVDSDVVANVSTTCDSELLLRAWLQAGDKGLAHVSGYFAFAGLFRAPRGWDCVIVRDDTARLRIGQLQGKPGGWAWGTTDEALVCGGAKPIHADHKRSVGLVYSPGKRKPREFRVVKAAKVKPQQQADWLVASGGSRSVWSAGTGGRWAGHQLNGANAE
jgi:hypothetical protein